MITWTAPSSAASKAASRCGRISSYSGMVLGLVLPPRAKIRPRSQSMSCQRSSTVSDGQRSPPNRISDKISGKENELAEPDAGQALLLRPLSSSRALLPRATVVSRS
ncbi:MAG: hypothetical protein EBR86_01410 [Planctomycetia bacterium]|nr:hypothetical protein [Planctomycetia bacterium]